MRIGEAEARKGLYQVYSTLRVFAKGEAPQNYQNDTYANHDTIHDQWVSPRVIVMALLSGSDAPW